MKTVKNSEKISGPRSKFFDPEISRFPKFHFRISVYENS